MHCSTPYIFQFRFQNFWRKVVTIFSRKAKDLEDLTSFYGAAGRILLVSVMRRQIVGVIAIREDNYKEDTDDTYEKLKSDCCEISRIFVHPKLRRLGIGARLLDEGEARARDKGYSKLKVSSEVQF